MIRVGDRRTDPLVQTAFLEAAGPQGTGWIRAANVRPGFSLSMADICYHEGTNDGFASGDNLKLHIRLHGRNSIRGVGMPESMVEPDRMSFLAEPEDRIKGSEVKREERLRAVTIACSREFLAPLLPTMSTPGIILDFLKAPATRFRHVDAAIPSPMRRVAEQMMTLRPGRLADMMLEAKALELLCLWVEGLSSVRDPAPLLPRNRKKTEELKSLLQTDAGMTMSLAQLSRTLAWNETQMMESFRRLTGTTISAYRQRRRMEHALAQLRTSDRSITDIAFEAGYEHPANFATAFKRSFGCSPRSARTRPA